MTLLTITQDVFYGSFSFVSRSGRLPGRARGIQGVWRRPYYPQNPPKPWENVWKTFLKPMENLSNTETAGGSSLFILKKAKRRKLGKIGENQKNWRFSDFDLFSLCFGLISVGFQWSDGPMVRDLAVSKSVSGQKSLP